MAAERGLTLASGVAEALAAWAPGSARELQGVVTKVEAMARLAGTREVGHALLRRLEEANGAAEAGAGAPLTMEAIVDAVTRATAVAPSALRGRGRQPRVVLARGVAATLARRLTALSHPEIARALGRGSHSGVVSSVKRIERRAAEGGEATELGAEAMPMEQLLRRIAARLGR
jgi:chromosomal replication initiation ATPase DnaA